LPPSSARTRRVVVDPLPPSAAPILNNLLEQDHRAIKRRVKAKQSFREFQAARRNMEGYEALHMIHEGQARWLSSDACSPTKSLHRQTVRSGGLRPCLRFPRAAASVICKAATLPSGSHRRRACGGCCAWQPRSRCAKASVWRPSCQLLDDPRGGFAILSAAPPSCGGAKSVCCV
jgi:DDE domain